MWVELGKLDWVKIGDEIYIPINAYIKPDKEGGNDGKESYKCTNNMLSNNIDDGNGEISIVGSIRYRRGWRVGSRERC